MPFFTQMQNMVRLQTEISLKYKISLFLLSINARVSETGFWMKPKKRPLH